MRMCEWCGYHSGHDIECPCHHRNLWEPGMSTECIDCDAKSPVTLGRPVYPWPEDDYAYDINAATEPLKVAVEDVINDPSHYQIMGSDGTTICEVREVQAHVSRNLQGMDAGDMNNAVKYLLRSPYKGKFVEDLKKARRFIDWLVERHDV